MSIFDRMKASDLTKAAAHDVHRALRDALYPTPDKTDRIGKWLPCVQEAADHLDNVLILLAREDENMSDLIRCEIVELIKHLTPLTDAVPLSKW